MSPNPPVNDSDLFDAVRAGDARALDELFRRYYADLCRVSIRFVQQAATAEDIVQEMFVTLWTRREKLPGDTHSVSGYLRRSVRNRSLNYLRDQQRIPVDDGELPDTTASYQTATAGIEQAEDRQRIDRAIDRLPERCRLVFVMSKVEEMTHQEIADGLDISVKTVENQMTRAYKYLRQWLAVLLLLITSAHA